MLELLYQALHSAHGIVVRTDDVQFLRQKLYAERRKAADPALAVLSFAPSPVNPEGELWIIKRESPDAQDT